MKTHCSRNGFVSLLIAALAYSTSHAATFTVTTTNAGGAGSLRQAILDANATPGLDTITFAIEPFDGTVKTIIPVTVNPLPDVTNAVIIDGYTQPGTSVNTLPDGDNAVLLIAINLTNNSSMRIRSGASTVRGLVLHSWVSTGQGLFLEGVSNIVEGCFLGTDATGTNSLGFGNFALSMPSGMGNRIGGTLPASRNVICGGAFGVDLFGGSNVIQGNFIGTDRHGAARLGRGTALRINDTAPGNLIGGTAPGARNVISGNMIGGIQISSSNNVVQGNFIGTDVTGTMALGNGSHGIALSSPAATDNLIGGTAAGAGNVICGSSNSGIDVGTGTARTIIQGNFIGTDRTGMLDLGNSGFGVFLGSGTNTVGGTVPAARNIVAGNGNNGIRISGSGNIVQGNFVGVGATGTNALPNIQGIYILGNRNFIGGIVAGAGNVVSGNGGDGIEVVNASDNVIQGNLIGTDPTGTRAVGNAIDGISVLGSGDGTNVIGRAGVSGRNVISGNGGNGVSLNNSSNVVQGNFIGTDITGTVDLGNGNYGVFVGPNGVSSIVGGAVAGAGNVISGNSNFGVNLGGASTANVIQGNLIGTDAAGNNALPNDRGGVRIFTSRRNRIGGGAPGEGNRIAFNVGPGIEIEGSTDTNNVISGNSIFSNTGSALLGDVGLGIDLFPFGVRINDTCDVDTGANFFQNYPVLTLATNTAGGVRIEGSLNSAASTTFTIELFASALCDPSGFGEGQIFLGSTNVTTDASCNANFAIFFPTNIPACWSITATARDPNGNTSEFSQCTPVRGGGESVDLAVGVTGNPSSVNLNSNVTYTIIVTNNGPCAATGVRITDTLPAGAMFVSASSGCTNVGGTVTCNLGLMAAGARATNQITIKAIAGPMIVNTVTVSGDQPDPLSGNNTATVTTLVATPACSTVVTNTLDSGPGSLRAAIECANSTPGLDTITFNIPGSGVRTITPLSALPTITNSVMIDGYTQPGASANTLANGDNAVILIELNGSTVGANGSGLIISSGNSTVRGLAIHGFFRNIELNVGGTNTVAGNFIGASATGTNGLGSMAGDGIYIASGSLANTIGGATPGARNIISRNAGNGVNTFGSGVIIVGNFIGVDRTGTNRFGNGNDGVLVQANSAVIGGTNAGERNIISGNVGDGLSINSSLAVIRGNFIGTDVTGARAMDNSFGISVSGSSNTIGGAAIAARNLISGNGNTGILVDGSDHIVQGNFIGVDVTGGNGLGNGNNGVNVRGTGILIGGGTVNPGTPPGNVISANTFDGVIIFGGQRNIIAGNIIGANVTGAQPLGNSLNGVEINGNANVVGGTNAIAANLIAFNGTVLGGASGIFIPNNASSTNNAVLGNSIFANSRLGIDLLAPAEQVGTPTPNDVNDVDDGANHLQNFPVLISVISSGGVTTIQGTLNSRPSSVYRIEFFANAACGSNSFGQGQTFVGATNVTTSAGGNANFTVGFPMPAGSFFTATATDTNGNTSEFSACASLATPCTITCSGNIVTTTGPGQCGAIVNFPAPTVNGTCGTVTCAPASGSLFARGATTVLCTNNAGTGCSFTVTVNDTQPPAITCPVNILTNAPAGVSNLVVNFPAPLASDNCPAVAAICTPPSGSAFPLGVTTVTCTATDASNNAASCSFALTVNSTTTTNAPPLALCRNVTNSAGANCQAVVAAADVDNGSFDPDGSIVSRTLSPPGPYPKGTNLVTLIVMDNRGASNSCAAAIVVLDTTPPVIVCPGSLTVQCDSHVPPANPAALAVTDNCDPAAVVVHVGDVVSGTCPKIITRTYKATDSSGNMNTCTQTITVQDTNAPVILGCQNLTAVAPSGQYGASVNFAVTPTDNCDESVAVSCVPSPGFFALGQTVVTCEAADRCGNRSTCSFTVTVTPQQSVGAGLCSFTQGFYGNARGRFNGLQSLALVGNLLGQGPLVVGKVGARSLSILSGDAVLLQQRLPSGGTPAPLPNNGDQTLQTATLLLNAKGRFADVFLGQAITLSLNARLSPALLNFSLAPSFCTQGILPGPDGLRGTADDMPVATDIQSFNSVNSVRNALTDPALGINANTVAGLLELANRGLAGLPTGGASLSEINAVVDAINRGFDECRALVNCSTNSIVPDSFNDSFSNRATLVSGAIAALPPEAPASPNTPPSPPPAPSLNLRVETSNLNASKQPGEPNIAGNAGGKSVWWQWRAPRTGPVKIQTAGSSFDTLLGVYTGATLANLVLVANNDDANGTLQSEVTFNATVDTNYQITVDGFDGASGSIILTLIVDPPRLCLPVTVVSNQLQVCIAGDLERTYTVEASPDLLNWTLIAAPLNSDGTLRFADPARDNYRQRFYRVTFEP